MRVEARDAVALEKTRKTIEHHVYMIIPGMKQSERIDLLQCMSHADATMQHSASSICNELRIRIRRILDTKEKVKA